MKDKELLKMLRKTEKDLGKLMHFIESNLFDFSEPVARRIMLFKPNAIRIYQEVKLLRKLVETRTKGG